MDHRLAIPLPSWQRSTVVAAAPGDGPGSWAGGPSAVLVDGTTYSRTGSGARVPRVRKRRGRLRRTVCTSSRSCASTRALSKRRRSKRPALVALPTAGFRIYVSCATPGTKHWRVDAIDADDPAGFDPEDRRTVLPGDADHGVKDPVLVITDGTWHMWATLHPLEVARDADRMHTAYATSRDGLVWRWRGTALEGRPGQWDARGTRVTAVRLDGERVVAAYDGRASAAENFEERTGIAVRLARAPRGQRHEPGCLVPVRRRAVCATSAGGSARAAGRVSTSRRPGPTARMTCAPISSRPRDEASRARARGDPRLDLGRRSGDTVTGGCFRAGSRASSRVVVAVTSATACSNGSRVVSLTFWMPLTLRSVLTGGGLDLFGGRGRLEPAQLGDVPAHASTLRPVR